MQGWKTVKMMQDIDNQHSVKGIISKRQMTNISIDEVHILLDSGSCGVLDGITQTLHRKIEAHPMMNSSLADQGNQVSAFATANVDDTGP
jgi:hypothetical protein